MQLLLSDAEDHGGRFNKRMVKIIWRYTTPGNKRNRIFVANNP